ncbi:MAG: hypothetical protein OEW00_02490 [candidate division Zixibacteria bacterium]|nr:hypothetical protein [candidate division Zixibacteria bacterium]
MSDLNLYSVNWQDGMLITQQHLKDQEKYCEEMVRWYALGAGDRYGLVKKSYSGKPALSLNIARSGRRLTIEVDRCQALTPDGHYVEINESSYGKVKTSVEIADGVAGVYMAVDPGAKGQVGEPDPSEEVPRVPYLTSSYSLHVGDRPNLPEGNFLQIARLEISGGDVVNSDGYYPPCLTLHADERLNQKVTDFKNRLEKLIVLSSQAYSAISADTALASEKTSLQAAFRETIGRFVYHLAGSYDQLVAGKNAAHPLSLIVFFKRLFRVFATHLNLHPGLRDYVNERYFMKETKSEIGRYLAAIDDFLLSPYNHSDLGGHIAAIDNLFGTLREILGFFAKVQTDQLGPQAVATESLTYRGVTYRLADYSSCRVENVGELYYLQVEIARPSPMSDAVILMAKDLFGKDVWSNMQVRLGLNEARGLGETDPVTLDTSTFGNKVALRAQDMVKSSLVKKMTLIFRGAGKADQLNSLGKTDLIIYSL